MNWKKLGIGVIAVAAALAILGCGVATYYEIQNDIWIIALIVWAAGAGLLVRHSVKKLKKGVAYIQSRKWKEDMLSSICVAPVMMAILIFGFLDADVRGEALIWGAHCENFISANYEVFGEVCDQFFLNVRPPFDNLLFWEYLLDRSASIRTFKDCVP